MMAHFGFRANSSLIRGRSVFYLSFYFNQDCRIRLGVLIETGPRLPIVIKVSIVTREATRFRELIIS